MHLERVTWPDNVCTVGHTSIHGLFDLEALRWLHHMHPQGWYTPTFYVGWGYWNTIVQIEANHDLGRGPQIGGYYFSFPYDDRAKALIVALKFKGFRMERKEPTWF